ncbi:MAG: hypothetical protein QCH96_05225 [Candidatus Thermoplasmatota archaeon]|nr:hypothetical protein [Candidatus Thermoplasmatota archaeon]
MQEILLIHMRRGKIVLDLSSKDIRDILDRLQGSIIYVFDEDGIKRNHPNVSLYQRLTNIAELWVDAGPRTVGDIVDDVFSGAQRIVIRPDLWVELDLHTVVDLTENELMALYHSSDIQKGIPYDMVFTQSHGVVLQFDEDSTPLDFKMNGIIKQICKVKPTYILDTRKQQMEKWDTFGITAVFRPLDQMEVFDK